MTTMVGTVRCHCAVASTYDEAVYRALVDDTCASCGQSRHGVWREDIGADTAMSNDTMTPYDFATYAKRPPTVRAYQWPGDDFPPPMAGLRFEIMVDPNGQQRLAVHGILGHPYTHPAIVHPGHWLVWAPNEFGDTDETSVAVMTDEVFTETYALPDVPLYDAGHADEAQEQPQKEPMPAPSLSLSQVRLCLWLLLEDARRVVAHDQHLPTPDVQVAIVRIEVLRTALALLGDAG